MAVYGSSSEYIMFNRSERYKFRLQFFRRELRAALIEENPHFGIKTGVNNTLINVISKRLNNAKNSSSVKNAHGLKRTPVCDIYSETANSSLGQARPFSFLAQHFQLQ